jgi:hypothetical protein
MRMPLPRRLAALCLPALLAFPATAGAAPFKDLVLREVRATAAQAGGPTARYPTADGLTIEVTGEPEVAQRYATYVGTLPHGAELAELKLVVVPAADVAEECGAGEDDGVLACYGARNQTMIVPDATPPGSDVSAEYVIAHEYGHHIARHRSNAPLDALDFGPKRWSSWELVCAHTLRGRLAPGDEGLHYRRNPGEAWAESYARLVFPNQAWRFTSLLRPTRGSLLAAMADVTQPWTKRMKTTFTGEGSRRFRLPLTLDGAFTLQLDGPADAEYDIVIKSGRKEVARTDRPGSRDRVHHRIACRDRRTETLTIRVLQRSDGGGGPYTLTARYAG